jgi:2-keto-4-pentenoate hydratase/2-oxohepta-3-ene-1,7-dioic acid hydratase in catechol pathway
MKVICIGRNYADHAKELNNPVPAVPVFFMKPDPAVLKNGEDFYLPEFSNEIHHELEIVLKISKAGKYIQEEFVSNYFEEIGLGIDFTARDLQQECKTKGLPWEIAKAFDGSAPIGQFVKKEDLGDLNHIAFHLEINGSTRQKGNTSDLLFDFNKIIAYVSQFVTLKTGDLIFTGTPAGVAAVNIGDNLKGFIGENCLLDFSVK